MAIESCWTADLDDLCTIELECKSCGAIQGLPTTNWKGHIPNECPNCGGPWFQLNGVSEISLQRFMTNFELFLKDKGARGCSVRLRVEGCPQGRRPLE